MQFDPLHATVSLTNEKVQFTGVARDEAAVTFDYTPPLGDGQGYTPLEMVLMSLAVCSGTALVALLRKTGKQVTGCNVKATGLRREQHPTAFRQISLDFAIESVDATEADLRHVLHLAETSICPVWTMLSPTVEITATTHLTGQMLDVQVFE